MTSEPTDATPAPDAPTATCCGEKYEYAPKGSKRQPWCQLCPNSATYHRLPESEREPAP